MAHTFSAVALTAVKYANSTQRHIFLTGKAGTGKTTLLQFIKAGTYKNVTVAAPTGIAAINAGGVTLHSLLQLPFGTFIPEDIKLHEQHIHDKINTPHSVLSQLQMSATKRDLLREIELLIIDEVSMLRADLLDCIDLILKKVRRDQAPFGGLQILFIGDLNQLPPVVKNSDWNLLSKYYKSPYFFEAHALRTAPPVFIELDQIYRQSDAAFVALLNRLRDDQLDSKDIALLNSYHKADFSPKPEEGFIHITTHNRKSDVLNQKRLDEIEAPTFTYPAKISGDFPEHMFPLPEKLTLKKGAQVMFIKNHPEGTFYNGKIGQIQSLDPDNIEVLLDNSEVVKVERVLWENKRYKLKKQTNEIEETIIGSFEQYPLKLAWAITVHKSQGLTFEKAILDLNDSFAPGQMYVALSRLTALEGLVLSSPVPTHTPAKDLALSDFSRHKKELNTLQQELGADCKTYLINSVKHAFDFSELLRELKYHLRSSTKDENRSSRQKYLGWTKDLVKQTEPLDEVSRKFIRQVIKISYEQPENCLELINVRVAKAAKYFIPLLDKLLGKMKAHKDLVRTHKQVKGYTKDLKMLESLYKKQKLRIHKTQLVINGIVNEKIPTKADLQKTEYYQNAEKEDKTEKQPTREITYNLYKKGHSVEDIAEERGLVATTIEGHLASFVASGELQATEFMDEEKLQQILTVAKVLDTTAAGAIKEKLGEEFSYGDIKMALAHRKAIEEKA